MMKKIVKKIAIHLENDARKVVSLDNTEVTPTKVFFGSQTLPKELR